tara:strand:+ start:119 stop:910 length:792 start_codon:yes stop_codon:yes gene_type:complete
MENLKPENNKNSVLKFISEWGLFSISILIIVAYTVISIKQDKTISENIWVNVLFIVLNLLAAFYISRQVALWGWQTENSTNQKKIAKTAIRHNRGNLTSLVKLLKITKEKIEIVEEPLIKQYLKEIKNHLEMIFNGIKNSEADFNEIVNEELKEQNSLEVEISELLDEIEQKGTELKEINSQSQEDKETINNLKLKIKEKESQLSLKVSSLPFGNTSYLSGTAFNLLENKSEGINLGGISLGGKLIDYTDEKIFEFKNPTKKK